jgi:plasmid stability protein
MEATTTRATVYLDSALHLALRLKAASSHRSISDIVNEAVRNALREDQEDLHDIEARTTEPTLSYEELLERLKADGTL